MTLSKIYTRTGDDGTTALGDMSRTSKNDPRLHAYADVDEANSALGVVLAGPSGGLRDADSALLRHVQNDLFDVGADLCTPLRPSYEHPPLRVTEEYVAALEAAIDERNAGMPALRSFVLPGGTPAAAGLHVARTVARRAERSTWLAVERYGAQPEEPAAGPGGVNPLTAHYLNRLSDLLFVLSRVANGPGGDVLWVPGGTRQKEVTGDDAQE